MSRWPHRQLLIFCWCVSLMLARSLPQACLCGVSINLLDVVTAISEKSPAIVTVKITRRRNDDHLLDR